MIMDVGNRLWQWDRYCQSQQTLGTVGEFTATRLDYAIQIFSRHVSDSLMYGYLGIHLPPQLGRFGLQHTSIASNNKTASQAAQRGTEFSMVLTQRPFLSITLWWRVSRPIQKIAHDYPNWTHCFYLLVIITSTGEVSLPCTIGSDMMVLAFHADQPFMNSSQLQTANNYIIMKMKGELNYFVDDICENLH